MPPLTESTKFLTRIYKSGVDYQSPSAIPSLLNSKTGLTLEKQETVRQRMKEILDLTSVLRKQMAIWDPDIALNYVKQLDETS